MPWTGSKYALKISSRLAAGSLSNVSAAASVKAPPIPSKVWNVFEGSTKTHAWFSEGCAIAVHSSCPVEARRWWFSFAVTNTLTGGAAWATAPANNTANAKIWDCLVINETVLNQLALLNIVTLGRFVTPFIFLQKQL
jgi:hypothetical protein